MANVEIRSATIYIKFTQVFSDVFKTMKNDDSAIGRSKFLNVIFER